MSFPDFHADPEICLSVSRIELTIKYRKIVIQKSYAPAEIWTLKNGKNVDEKP